MSAAAMTLSARLIVCLHLDTSATVVGSMKGGTRGETRRAELENELDLQRALSE